MLVEINLKLNKVRQIIKDFDEFKFEYSQANSKFVEGNRLLDECLEIINRDNFKVEKL